MLALKWEDHGGRLTRRLIIGTLVGYAISEISCFRNPPCIHLRKLEVTWKSTFIDSLLFFIDPHAAGFYGKTRWSTDVPRCSIDYGKPNWREKRRKRCKTYLTTLGRKLGFDVSPQLRRAYREYMVDLCWISQKESTWSMELAVEMEWDARSHYVQYDFSKLVHLKCPRKIMLCVPFPSERRDTLSQIIDLVSRSKYRSSNEQYAIIFFVFSKRDRELIRDRIEARGFLIDYKRKVTSELFAQRESNGRRRYDSKAGKRNG